MELGVVTLGKKSTGKITVSDENFGQDFNEGLVHQVVVAYLAGARAGTSAQKTRSEVRGGGKKPWRQKGTGRARAGTIRSPIWRKGGVTFASKPRSYEQKVNRKMYRKAMKSILSELVRQDRLLIIDQLSLEQPKTREWIEKANKLNIKDMSVLIITESFDTNIQLATRNLHNIEVCAVNEINPVNLIGYDKVLITADAIKKVEDNLA